MLLELIQTDLTKVLENVLRIEIIESETNDLLNYKLITASSRYNATPGMDISIDDKFSFRFDEDFLEKVLINELDDFDFHALD